MESQETQKLIDNLRSDGVEIRVLRSLVDPSVFHCILTKEHIRGFGTDTDSSLALLKACAEFNERLDYHRQVESGLASTSNGFAAHSNFELASRSAINELIERDTFLTSWATRQPPYWLSDDEVM
ncbi:YcaO-like family protein [Oligoflexus sp.]|uniref:YcaO-like family protein n=1 Tax=Oligoflexus sp. TaxID=1971216 RepID=UPI0039C985E8